MVKKTKFTDYLGIFVVDTRTFSRTVSRSPGAARSKLWEPLV